MLVTLLGISMDWRPLQQENALPHMLVTLAGITDVLHPNIRYVPSLDSRQLFRDMNLLFSWDTSIDWRLLQQENAPFPMLVTLSGISMDWRPLQQENVSRPMLVTLLGISMDWRLLQP